MTAAIDPIVLEIVNSKITSIVDEMRMVLFHSGYSTVLRESEDGSARALGCRAAHGRRVEKAPLPFRFVLRSQRAFAALLFAARFGRRRCLAVQSSLRRQRYPATFGHDHLDAELFSREDRRLQLAVPLRTSPILAAFAA